MRYPRIAEGDKAKREVKIRSATMTDNLFWLILISFLAAGAADEKVKSAEVESNNEVDGNSAETGGNLVDSPPKSEKSKTDILADVFRKKVEELKTHRETELVILVDGSSSIGKANFKSEMKYIQKVISDVNVSPTDVRLAIIIYSTAVVTHVNHLQFDMIPHEKCSLLQYDIRNIKYPGGNTNTKGALLESEKILKLARETAQKIIFLVTDGFSNKGNPVPVAERLRNQNVTIYTFGIVNGNVEELRKMASSPAEEHSYLFESFGEFEGFERRALHQDLKPGKYVGVNKTELCNVLCENPESGCCNKESKCGCGVLSGHFSCLCPPGYYGSGLWNEKCKLCPNGTYSDGTIPGDDLACTPCPDNNQITIKSPATSKDDCECVDGYVKEGYRCKVKTCPELTPPSNAYFVSNKCSNVLNAACGIRCHAGFILSGSSVRICQKNRTWSGTPPHCTAKRCQGLKPVPNANVICVNDEDNFEVVVRYNSTGDKVKHFVKWSDFKKDENGTLKKPQKLQEYDVVTNKTIELNYTVDTECKYSCARGYFLVGSKSRSCLPMLKWSGLKTTCKAIKCHALQKIENGTVLPENCTTKGLKHHFAEVCEYSCNPGYELKGPNITNCTGRHGSWSQKNNPSKCIDVEPPKFDCPDNITTPTDEGVHFATVNWSLPIATDNSGTQPMIWSKPPFDTDHPLRFVIGDSEIQIYSVDGAGNYGFCSFTILVEDTESPKVFECISPPNFYLSEFPPNATEIKWKEPVFDDNSGVPLPVKKTPSTSNFPLGVTPIEYVATDYAGNNASCVLNITILDNPCSERPEISNTLWNCSTNKNFTSCNISCAEGFALATNVTNSTTLTLNCTYFGRKATWSPDLFHGDVDLFPECSEAEAPTEITGEIVIEGSDDLCNDLEALKNEISNEIGGLGNDTIFTVCEDDASEEGENGNKEEDSEKEKEEEKLEEDTNVIRKKRTTRKRRKKLKIGFSVKGKETSSDDVNKDLNKTKIKVQEFYAKHGESGLLRRGKGDIRSNVRLHCRKGFLLKQNLNLCVKCPRGTFHNAINATCDPCPLGEYQEIEGQATCTPCPEGYSTRKLRRKNANQCKRICPPGTYGRKRGKNMLALAPCTTCPVGSYQPLEAQTSCQDCPEDFTTVKRGSTRREDCVRKAELEDLCFRFQCRNGGSCFVVDGFAICKCPPGFLGAFCEQKFNPCGSSPCYNNAKCIRISPLDYQCKCPPGFEGINCEREVNECSSNPCGDRGECNDLFDGYSCTCFPGFKGENCRETVSPCEELQPCQNSGTCVDANMSYECHCPENFTGLHCEEPADCFTTGSCGNEGLLPPKVDPCEGVSCEGNTKCEVGRHRQPLCVCAEGYRGENCSEVINPHVVLHFPKYGVTEYLSADFPPKDLFAISICVWLQTKDDFNYGTLFSYATRDDDNAFTLTDYSGLVLYVSGEHVVTDLTANDGKWHFICVTWHSNGGRWKVYLDGAVHSSGGGLTSGSTIPGNGKLVVGQEQDFFGGGFNEVESFSGRLTYFDVWNRLLEDREVKNLYEKCEDLDGNLISWKELLQNLHGAIQEEESKFCTNCSTNLKVFRGIVSYEYEEKSMTAKYECDEGFSIKFEKGAEARKEVIGHWYRQCLKFGWEWKEPKCSRVSCGFPGYFINGKIDGGSYLYGDVIKYECNEGYSLIGNDTRVCQSDGAWTGDPPTCHGNFTNCRKLVAPRHGSMFVYFTSNRPYGRSLPEVGDRIEFTCDKGYRLRGFGLLTCLDGGMWDRDPPNCHRIECQYPQEAANLMSLVIPDTATFEFGQTLRITCTSGREKIIMCGDFGMWNFTADTCGTKCLEKPRRPKNGFIIEDDRHEYGEGMMVYVRCRSGFLLSGDNQFVCGGDGNWTQVHPTLCNPVACGPPPRPPRPYFIANKEGYTLGLRIHLECEPGYLKTGEISMRCQPDGRWSRIQNTCTRVPCNRPEIPEGYTTEDDRSVLFYQDVIRLKCPSGKRFVDGSVDYVVCQIDGLWSQIPQCL